MSCRIADIPVPPQCRAMIQAGTLVAINHSGGKDSQAMTILLSRIVPRDRIVAVHAPLGEIEWPGTIEHIETTLPAGVPLIFAPVASGKSLLDRVEERGMFPGVRQRWCTAGHKRGPIERELRRYLKAHPRFGGRLVNCLGLRRDESAARAKRVPWRRNERMSAAGREVFDWLPIFDLSTADVFRVIRTAGQKPHWIYNHLGRCSCSFCIFSSPADLRRAAQPRLNIFGDDALAQLCAQVNEKIAGVEPDALRPSKTFDPAARARVKRDADALAEKFAGYFAPQPEPAREAA